MDLTQKILEKLNSLESRIEALEKRVEQIPIPFQLMYKRPTKEDYESLSNTLDYLHNNIEGVKEDVYRLATR